MTNKLMHIYLSDHLAGATAGAELAKRCLSNNRGSPLGDFLQELLGEIEADIRALESFMDDVGAPRMAWKQRAAWLAERIARLKLNGRVRSYSPLSRVLELEGLSLGVAGKAALWRSLDRVLAGTELASRHDFGSLIARAESQRQGLEAHRLQAATVAFGMGSG